MAELIEVRVPDIGDFDGVEVIEVLVSEGDQISAEDSLLSLESDKATMEVPSPTTGQVKQVKVSIGDTVAEGDLILTLEASEEGASVDQAAAPEQASAPEPSAPAEEPPVATKPAPAPATIPEPLPPPVSFDASTSPPGKVPHASPSVRSFARQLGVNLAEVPGTGRKGRIVKEDVEQFVKGVMQSKGGGGGAASAGAGLGLLDWPRVDFSKFGEVENVPLSKIRRLTGANLSRNWVMIPHVTQHDQADITEMEAFRKAHADQAKAEGFKLTPLVFLIQACVAALKKFPDFNASLEPGGDSLILKKYFHIGVAVDTPNGLVVPVLRDCDQKSLFDLARELGEISVKARDRKLGPGDMQGGCFTISSLGGIGGTAFTPIINAPEVAILGVPRSQMKPIWNGSEFEPRLMLPLSLSYDHRVIDGASGARFTGYLAHLLSDVRRLLL
jgi:pyruvate dehydrogenase E2 component (dihydrolipoamide acetyltransferase)